MAGYDLHLDSALRQGKSEQGSQEDGHQHDPEINSTITLFSMDPDLIPHAVQRIIHSQSFIHEMAHSIVSPALLRKDLRVVRTDGVTIRASELLLAMQEELRQSGPVSHYSSAYWSNGQPRGVRGVNEEFCEIIARLLLGFTYRPANKTAVHFDDRAEMKRGIREFLYAEPPEVT